MAEELRKAVPMVGRWSGAVLPPEVIGGDLLLTSSGHLPAKSSHAQEV